MALWTNNWIKRDLFVLQWPPSGKRGRVKESKNSSPFDIPFVKHRSMLGLAECAFRYTREHSGAAGLV